MPWSSTKRIYAKPSGTGGEPTFTSGSAPAPIVLPPLTPEASAAVYPGDTAAGESGGRYELGQRGYGKNDVKLLHVRRDGDKHEIREYEVCTELKLLTQKDYVSGDNKDVIATDSQKNTIYLLAKKHGVKTPEEFGALVVSHFLYTYRQLSEARCRVLEYPWERLQASGAAHNHAFMFSPTATRWCEVSQKRHESVEVKSGLTGLRVLKTTQSSFVDFVQDEYTTLADAAERIFSTVVEAEWEYERATGVNFDDAWLAVKDAVLEKFAGPPDVGVYSPSVQNTIYLAEKMVLDQVPQISWIKMTMPNKHYLNIDLSKFPPSVTRGDPSHQIYHPVDKPAGLIYAQLRRRARSHL